VESLEKNGFEIHLYSFLSVPSAKNKSFVKTLLSKGIMTTKTK
jgi:hypothetical protein